MDDREYMRRAIHLARRGWGWTSPNPLVGAVIVKEGRIIAEGWHARWGQPHAERCALARCTEDPAGATLYVTLEPCCHQGRTPPCTEALIEAGISRVIIGSRDPNPKVSGRGAALLRAHGIAVEEAFLRRECDALNPIFFHYITTGQPYVALKYAMTADGKLATVTGASQWITGAEARAHVHTLRGRYRAILAGIGTVLADDPLLSCRAEGGRNPVRVICDSRLRIPPDCRICRTARRQETIVACAENDPEKRARLEGLGITVLCLPDGQGRVDLAALAAALGQRGIDSILVEGGIEIHAAALAAGIVRRIYAYVGARVFGGRGAKSPLGGPGAAAVEDGPRLALAATEPFGDDLLLTYDIKEGEK